MTERNYHSQGYQAVSSQEPKVSTQGYAGNNGTHIDGSNATDIHNKETHIFHGKKLGLAGLIVLSFYTVCGGPFGIEDIVRAGGPFFAILGFVLIAVWAIPEAMITAELSVAMPESSGSVAWVDAAFGDFWAFQKGWLSWLSGIADNALYPILFLDCLLQLVTDENGNNFLSGDDGTIRWSLLMSVTTLLTYLNYRGLEVVGRLAILICLLSLAPFVVFCLFGLPHVQTARWFAVKPGGLSAIDWRLLLNTFFWNINFWESASSFSADVENPAENYPKGMIIAVVLVFLSLLLPILVGVGASDNSTQDFSEWTDGYFVGLAKSIVGEWLGVWMIAAATITNIGMFEAEMSSDAWQVAGMAEKGKLPSFLAKRNKYDSPTYGILLSATGVICLNWLAFSEVIDMLNLLYCYAQLIEFAAYLKLRNIQAHYYPRSHNSTSNIRDIANSGLELPSKERSSSNEPQAIAPEYEKLNVMPSFASGTPSDGLLDSSSPIPKRIKFYLSINVMTGLLLLPVTFIFIILWFSSTASLLISGTLALSGIGMYHLLKYLKSNRIVHFFE